MKLSIFWIFILGALTAIGPLCTDLYLPSLPEIKDEMGISSSLTQLTLTASLLGLGVGQFIFGPISDRVGRKSPLIVSLIIFIVSSILCATTNNIYWLIIWRFLQGISGAGGSVLSRAIARDKYNGIALINFFAMLMTVNGIAPVVSPVLGGYILILFNWRMLFWVIAGAGFILLICSILFIKETHERQIENTSFKKICNQLTKNHKFIQFCLIQAFMLAGLFAYIGSSSFVLQNEYGLNAVQFSLIFGLNGIGLIFASLIFSRLARHIPTMKLLHIGLFVAICCSAITFLFSNFNLPITTLVGLFFAISINSGICTVAGAEAMNVVSSNESGIASALLGLSMFLFGGLAAPLSGLGGESMIKMSVSILICYLLSFLISIIKIKNI